MEILESGLTQLEARDREDAFLHKYAEEGYVILNRAKTGRMIGSVGGMHVKWGKTACLREAHKYKSRGEFEKGSPSAYQAALMKHWLDECTWFVPGQGWSKRVCRARRDSRIVCQYGFDGQLLASFPTLADATRATGIMSIRKCLIGERRQAGGFFWKYGY